MLGEWSVGHPRVIVGVCGCTWGTGVIGDSPRAFVGACARVVGEGSASGGGLAWPTGSCQPRGTSCCN